MATQPQTGLTYQDLQSFPEDNLRRELIEGEHILTAAPATRHQRVVTKLVVRLWLYAQDHGVEVLPAPFVIYFAEPKVAGPAVLFVAPRTRTKRRQPCTRSAPDLRGASS